MTVSDEDQLMSRGPIVLRAGSATILGLWAVLSPLAFIYISSFVGFLVTAIGGVAFVLSTFVGTLDDIGMSNWGWNQRRASSRETRVSQGRRLREAGEEEAMAKDDKFPVPQSVMTPGWWKDEVDELGRRTITEEIGFDELSPDCRENFKIPERMKPYLKRDLLEVRFLRARFVVGDEKIVAKWMKDGYTEEEARKMLADTVYPVPLLTKEEQRQMDEDYASRLRKVFGAGNGGD